MAPGGIKVMAARSWRVRGWIWWLGAIPGLTVLFQMDGAPDLAALAGRWARTWPWLVLGWWLLVPLPSLVAGKGHPSGWRQTGGLVAFVFCGVLLTGVTHLAPMPALLGLGFGEHLDLYDLLGENSRFSESREWLLDTRRPVRVENPYGSVRLRVSPDDRLRLEVFGAFRTSGPMDENDLSLRMTFGLEEHSDGYLVAPRFDPPGSVAFSRRFRARLEVAVPAGHDVALTNRGGGVEVVGSPGGLRILAADSDVRVRRPGGRVDVVALRGNVRVELPSDAGVEVSGEVFGGSFRSDFPGPEAIRRSWGLELAGVSDGVGPPVPMRFDVAGGSVSLVAVSAWRVD